MELAPADISIGAELRAGRYARLTVADDGPGMSREVLEHIFEPFFTTKAPGEGSGLGLSAVHGIMRSHDGAVTVTSEPGAGATFQLYFPALETLTPVPTKATRRALARGNGEHILFVDDEASLVKLGQGLLAQLGYRVTALRDPVAALAAFLEAPASFDAAVLDFAMPGFTGVELARHLHESRPDLPIIIVTGYPAAIPPEELKRADVHDVLAKPGSLDALSGCLARLLKASARRDAPRA